MSAPSEDEELDFINSLPSALDTALNDSGGAGNNSIYKKSFTRESSNLFRPTSIEVKPEEEGLLRRLSISSPSSDNSPIHPQRSRMSFLPRSQKIKIKRVQECIVQTTNFWRRNRGLCEVFLSQILSALVNTTTRILETEDEPIPPFSLLFIRMAMTMILGIGYMWLQDIPAWPLGERDAWGLLHLRGVLGFWSIAGFLCKFSPKNSRTLHIDYSLCIGRQLADFFDRLAQVLAAFRRNSFDLFSTECDRLCFASSAP